MNDSERTFTITDLKNWRAISEQFDVPALLSVFGNPVEHSLSPQLHNPALKFCDIKSQYVKIKVREKILKTERDGFIISRSSVFYMFSLVKYKLLPNQELVVDTMVLLS